MRILEIWTSKNAPRRQFLIILISKSFSRAGVVRILEIWTSKPKSFSRTGVVQILETCELPKMFRRRQFFHDFDFQIDLARRRGANFGDVLASRSSAPANRGAPDCIGQRRASAGELPSGVGSASRRMSEGMPEKMSEDMSEDMSKRDVRNMSDKNVRRYVTKGGQKYARQECQKMSEEMLIEMSENMSEKDVRRYVKKGCQKYVRQECQKKC